MNTRMKRVATVLGLVAGVGLLLPSAARADEFCGTTWTDACASVSISFTGNQLVMRVSNTSDTSNPDVMESLISWMQVKTDPTSQVTAWDVCTDASCTNSIKNYWTASTNSQGGISWSAGARSGTGNSGIITDAGTCNGGPNRCWTGPVYFVVSFEEDISSANLASLQFRRLGSPSYDDSEWITVVPEPVTSTLFGLGALGWLGVEARRRRRERLALEEDGDDLA